MLIVGVCQLQDIVCRVSVAVCDIIWMVFLVGSSLMISVTQFFGSITAHGPTSRCDLK